MDTSIRYISDQELIRLVINEPKPGRGAAHLIESVATLPELMALTPEEIIAVDGIGKQRASQLVAAVELARRVLETPAQQRPVISRPEDAAVIMMPLLRFQDREHFRCLYLDRKSRLIANELISIGGLSNTSVHPREFFKPAIRRSAAGIIAVHNHPSGDPSPSAEDISITRRLVEAGQLLGIDVLDHLIIGGGNWISLKSRGLM